MYRRGGLRIADGEGIRVINCVIHDTGGIAIWKSYRDIEIYGCLSYNNGWVAPDRGHTHGNYMQSYKGNRNYFSESIMFNNFGG